MSWHLADYELGPFMEFHHHLTFYGLVAAVFNDALQSQFASPRSSLTPWMSSAPQSPWKMNRATLVHRLQEMGIPLQAEWSVPELRATLIEELEARGERNHQSVGLTRLTLAELKDRCDNEGLMAPSGATRGTLMKILRDNVPPTDNEVAPFGRYKNYHYKEVDEDYLQWAIKEVKVNDNHSPDLARLARWAEAQATHGSGSIGQYQPSDRSSAESEGLSEGHTEEEFEDNEDKAHRDGGRLDRGDRGGGHDRGPDQGDGIPTDSVE